MDTCKICGSQFGPRSFGGPGICPACDCGITPQQAQQAEIALLRERLVQLEEEDRQWDKHGLCDIINQRDAPPMNDADLRALCERLRGLGDPKQWASNHAVALCDEGADAIEALVAERDARITELEQRNSELERGEILTDKDLLSSVITAVMSGKQSERDDACRKLQRHIIAVEDERDNREAECERLSADNLSLNERLGVCAIQLALSERKIRTLAVTDNEDVDDQYCTCPIEHDNNEQGFNKCSACGKRIDGSP